jgi:hypothetical protein
MHVALPAVLLLLLLLLLPVLTGARA